MHSQCRRHHRAPVFCVKCKYVECGSQLTVRGPWQCLAAALAPPGDCGVSIIRTNLMQMTRDITGEEPVQCFKDVRKHDCVKFVQVLIKLLNANLQIRMKKCN